MDEFDWCMEWNDAVDTIPYSSKNNVLGTSQREVLKHLLRLSETELETIVRNDEMPAQRVMQAVRMISGPHGRTWMKLRLRDYPKAGELMWPDKTPVFAAGGVK